MFVRVDPEPVIDEIHFLNFLPILLTPVPARLLFISLESLFSNFCPYDFANEPIILNGGNNKNGLVASTALGIINPPDYIVLDN